MLVTKKNSPHLFFAAGLAGVVAGTILACRATLKLDDTLDEIQNDFQTVRGLHDGIDRRPEYSDHEYHKDLGYVYTRSAVKLGKLYGPSVIVGTISIAALTGSHVQLARRNTALMITLSAVSKAFDEYRIRVQEEIGEEREREIRHAVTKQAVEIDGKKQLVKVADSDASPYAKSFDSSNQHWEGNSEYNRIFIQCQQNYLNHQLNARGHVFLNEAYDHLGLERTPAGAVVGWVRNGDGDGYIDFGLFESFNHLSIYDQNFILDFNVDGVIYDKI